MCELPCKYKWGRLIILSTRMTLGFFVVLVTHLI